MQKVRVRARRAAVRVSPCLYGNGITPITTQVSSVQDPREQQGVVRERGSRQHAVYHKDMHFARRVVYHEDVLSITKTCSLPAGLSITKTCRLPRRRAFLPAGSSTTKTCCLTRRHAVCPQGWLARQRHFRDNNIFPFPRSLSLVICKTSSIRSSGIFCPFQGVQALFQGV